jgi:hypothetical protein
MVSAAYRTGNGSAAGDGGRISSFGGNTAAIPRGLGHHGPAKPAIVVTTDSDGVDPKPAIEVTAGFLLGRAGSTPEITGAVSACEPYAEIIALELDRGRNAMGIWQDLVDNHGFAGGYQSVKRYVRKLRGTVSAQARVIIQTQPGEECQVDYGTGPMVRDPDSSRYRRTRLFVLTLGYSRKSVRLLTFRSGTRVWAELREGVLSADLYDPCLNPLYRDVLAHYGVTALPVQGARSRSKRKSRIRRRPYKRLP